LTFRMPRVLPHFGRSARFCVPGQQPTPGSRRVPSPPQPTGRASAAGPSLPDRLGRST
jgi:hypothetical protein